MKKELIGSILLLISWLGYSQTATEVCALNIGVEVPSAKITSVEGKEVDVKEIVSNKPTVLVFYRGGWCPYCTKHLSELRDIEKDINDLGYQIAALSTDAVDRIPETTKSEKISYQLYSDRKYNAMNAFGIGFTPKTGRLPIYSRVMEMLEEEVLVPVPSLFVIEEGKIVYRYVNPNYSTRISSDLILSVLKSLK